MGVCFFFITLDFYMFGSNIVCSFLGVDVAKVLRSKSTNSYEQKIKLLLITSSTSD